MSFVRTADVSTIFRLYRRLGRNVPLPVEGSSSCSFSVDSYSPTMHPDRTKAHARGGLTAEYGGNLREEKKTAYSRAQAVGLAQSRLELQV